MATPTYTSGQWLMLWQKLHTTRLHPLPTDEEVGQFMAILPERRPDETMSSWLNRSQKPRPATVIPLPKHTIRPITGLQLMAASDGSEKYPLPEKPLVTPDQSFRYAIARTGEGLEISLVALGFAIEDYASQRIGITAPDKADDLIAVILLDDNGEGRATVEDSERHRKVLCVNPMFVLVEPEDD